MKLALLLLVALATGCMTDTERRGLERESEAAQWASASRPGALRLSYHQRSGASVSVTESYVQVYGGGSSFKYKVVRIDRTNSSKLELWTANGDYWVATSDGLRRHITDTWSEFYAGGRRPSSYSYRGAYRGY